MKGKRSKEKAAKAGRPALFGAAVTALVFVAILGAAAVLFIFNLFGAKGLVIDFLDIADEASQRDREELERWGTELSNQADLLSQDQNSLTQKEREVAEREAAVAEMESELEVRAAEYDLLTAQLQVKSNDITTVARSLEKMSAEAAGALLSAMSDKESMLRIFSQLKPAAQAAILETMDANAAAALVEGLSKKIYEEVLHE